MDLMDLVIKDYNHVWYIELFLFLALEYSTLQLSHEWQKHSLFQMNRPIAKATFFLSAERFYFIYLFFFTLGFKVQTGLLGYNSIQT